MNCGAVTVFCYNLSKVDLDHQLCVYVFSVLPTDNYFFHSNISHSKLHQLDVQVEVSEEMTNCSRQENGYNAVYSLSDGKQSLMPCNHSSGSCNTLMLNDIAQDTSVAPNVKECESQGQYKENASEIVNIQPEEAELLANSDIYCADDKLLVFGDSERCELTPVTKGEKSFIGNKQNILC